MAPHEHRVPAFAPLLVHLRAAALRRSLFACLVSTLSIPSAAYAQTVVGVVVDPQERRVARADLRLTCGGEVRRTVSDEQGRFQFERPAGIESCVLHVAASGFSALGEIVGVRRWPWVVRLELERLTETVDVRAPSDVQPARAGHVVLTGDQLREISDDPREIVRVARARAGAGDSYAVYVDGLRSERLPAVGRIAAVEANADPFSAEHSDPGSRRIEITTGEPDRRWHFNAGGTPPTVGGRDPLAPGNRSGSRSFNGLLSGPLPWAQASFGIGGDLDESIVQPAIVAVTGGRPAPLQQPTEATTGHRRLSFQFQQEIARRVTLRIDGQRAADRSTNAGVGGEVLAEAGQSRHGGDTELRLTLTHSWPRVVWRNRVLGDWQHDEMTASSIGAGVWVPGAFVAGGAPTLSSRTAHSTFLWKSIFGSTGPGRDWRAGVTVQRMGARASQVPNAAGHLQVSPTGWSEMGGLAAGNYFRSVASTSQRVALSEAAGFGEVSLLSLPRASLKGGVRIDWQSRDRAYLSPRVSGTVRAGRWTFGGGIGAFTQSWRSEVLLGTRAAAGDAPVETMWRDVSIAHPDEGGGQAIFTDVARGFTRARYLMGAESAERRFGPVTAGLEHTWWRGRRLPGGRRLFAGDGAWCDWIESNRSADSHELRARVEAGGRRANVGFSYGWVHAVDDADGAFSFPERQDDLESERARAARVPAHNVDVVASGSLPAGVRLTTVVTLRSASPYNIISGLDAEGNGLTTDRGGRARNSGDGPTYRMVCVYLHRRFDLGALLGARGKVPIDAGAQIENLLGTRNWTALGNVLASPLFGRPLGAMPGRSIRVWFAVAR